MKLSQQQLLSLVKQIIPNVELADADNPDFNAENLVETFVNTREPVFRKKFTDEEVPKLTTQIAGQIGAKVRTAIKKLSKGQIKDSDLKDLQDEDAMQLLLSKMVDLSGKDTEQLRQQLEKVVEDNNAALDALKNEYEGKLTAEKTRVTDQLTLDKIEELHKKFPLLKGDNKERSRLLKTIGSSKYALVYNSEKEAVELRDLKNPESPVIKDNKVYTFENFAEDYYKGIGLWQIDARHQQTGGGGNDNPPIDTKGMTQVEADLASAIAAI